MRTRSMEKYDLNKHLLETMMSVTNFTDNIAYFESVISKYNRFFMIEESYSEKNDSLYTDINNSIAFFGLIENVKVHLKISKFSERTKNKLMKQIDGLLKKTEDVVLKRFFK